MRGRLIIWTMTSRLSARLAAWMPISLIAAAAGALCLYAYFLPDAPGGAAVLDSRWISSPAFTESGDVIPYLLRFCSSFLFLGLFPLIASGVLLPRTHGNSLWSMIGLRRPVYGLFTWKPFLPLFLTFIIVGALGSRDAGLASYYPYSKTLTVDSASIPLFALHALSYILLFYIPWELLFRGIFILPLLNYFLEDPGEDPGTIDSRALTLASLQVIPSALLHFGHPISESLGAVVFGAVAGFTVLHYRSIWPAVILHASSGLALDLTLTLKALS